MINYENIRKTCEETNITNDLTIIRIISARKATKAEEKYYGGAI